MDIRFDILESNSNGDGDGVVWVEDDGIGVDWEDSVGVVEAMDLWLWYHERFGAWRWLTMVENLWEREREREFLKWGNFNYTSSKINT